MRDPHIFLRLSNAAPSLDGTKMAVLIETEDAPPFDLSIPYHEIGGIVQFLVLTANMSNPEPGKGQQYWDPIPLQGIGFAAGNSPEETLLVVRLGVFDLAFQMQSQRLKELGDHLSRTLKTMSAQGEEH